MTRHHPVTSESRFASRLTRLLDESGRQLPPGVEERLRFAREQALARARLEQCTPSPIMPLGAALGWLGGWWPKAAAVLPVIVLAGGLVAIEQRHRDEQITAAVEIDSALLTDDAPLVAYRDAGFIEFLKVPAN